MGNFGTYLKEKRLALGLTQKQVADNMGVYQQTIARYEKAERLPKTATLQRLADAMGISLSDLTEPYYKDAIKKQTQRINDYPEDIAINAHLLEIRQDMKQLNTSGRKEAVKRVHELTEIPKYKKDNEDK